MVVTGVVLLVVVVVVVAAAVVVVVVGAAPEADGVGMTVIGIFNTGRKPRVMVINIRATAGRTSNSNT